MLPDDGGLLTCFASIRQFLCKNLWRMTLRKLLFLLIISSFCSLLLYVWIIVSYEDEIDFYTTHNSHFIRFVNRKLSFSNCFVNRGDVLKEEQRIFRSIRQEHLELVKELKEKKNNLNTVLVEFARKKTELEELQLHISQLRILQGELNDRRNVKLSLPNAPLRPELSIRALRSNISSSFSHFEQCIDYRRCSISSLFRYYLYRPATAYKLPSTSSLYDEFLLSPFRTENSADACIFVALFESNALFAVKHLRFWQGMGRNHLIIINQAENILRRDMDYFAAMVIASGFADNSLRIGVDIAVDLDVPRSNVSDYQRFPRMFPYAREYLLMFIADRTSMTKLEIASLQQLKKSAPLSGDSFHFDLECSSINKSTERMALCYDEKRRVSLTRRAHFTLIFADSESAQSRLREALVAGTIPVIVSSRFGNAALPFDEFLDWRLAIIRVAASRLPELHFILRSISVTDLLEMRRKGRLFLENYLANTRVLSRAIIATIRFRLQMLADGPPSVVTNVLTVPHLFQTTATRPSYDDEYLGPMETPIPSAAFTHNFTSLRMYSYKIWNELPSHLHFTPEYIETDFPYPSEAEFDNEANFGMRPISPGSGQEFSMALGGNRQREQFTIVIVTHNRNSVLNASLERLHKLPYLNKVLVVWNNVDRPNNLTWPRIHAPIVFLNASRNSLNNRFLPFREIETEAVLSLDDDIDLKQHEIIFAFRTWRENRHRIVGFPARYHAKYGNSMFYNSNHTCQLSMILTGAAFFHKSYLYAYTYSMPEIIRRKVDEWMNCEDLAMNFLVSHLTRLPPIKTTSKWTIKCPTCPKTLSDDLSHFNERHNCIRFFTQVYGYNPLLFSQFRADSVLFKTRVPSNQQKCFRYV